MSTDNKSDVSTDSDYSDVEESTWEVSQHFVLPFGKYRGKQMAQMVGSGKRRHYLRYLQKWDELMPRTRAHIECALSEYDALKRKAATQKVAQGATKKAKKAK